MNDGAKLRQLVDQIIDQELPNYPVRTVSTHRVTYQELKENFGMSRLSGSVKIAFMRFMISCGLVVKQEVSQKVFLLTLDLDKVALTIDQAKRLVALQQSIKPLSENRDHVLKAFERFCLKTYPNEFTKDSFCWRIDGRYENDRVHEMFNIWLAAREDFQNRLDQMQHAKDLNRPVSFREGCDCGCNTPSFTEPFEALRFLMHRMNHAGVGEAVGASYAHDIMQILKAYNAVEADAHITITQQ